MKEHVWTIIAFVLVMIGALNWGLVGLFGWNLVGALFGDMSLISRLIYILVGLAAIWLIATSARRVRNMPEA